MRLTLRTMLAYLDDILEPEDAATLGKKIEESEFASGLVHRIRSSMKRIRLGAPRLEGRGIGLDPNSVAEYLDNTLAAERVPDFEKVCLESELHLAEVASSHQILALVLGEPAEISPSIRERVYRIDKPASEPAPAPTETLAKSAAAATVAQAGAAGAETSPRSPAVDSAKSPAATPASGGAAASNRVPGSDAAAVSPSSSRAVPGKAAAAAVAGPQGAQTSQPVAREKPEIPEYLRPEKRSIWPLLLTMLLVFAVVGGALMAIYPNQWSQSVAMLTGGSSSPEVNGDDGAEKTPPAAPSAPVVELGTPADPAPATSPIAPPLTPGVLPADNTPDGIGIDPPPATSQLPLSTPPSVDPVLPPANNGASTTTPSSDLPPLPAAVNPFDPGTSATPPGTLTPVDPPADPLPLGTPPSDPLGGNTTDPAVPPADAPLIARIDDPAPPAAPAPAPVAQPAAVQGHYISVEEALIKYDPKGDDWNRVPVREAISSGDWLLVLPTYRPQIVLTAGLELTLSGGTLLEIGPPTADGVPTVRLKYGRLEIATMGKAGARANLEIGTRRGVVVFANADSALAMEVARFHDPGADPVERPAHASALLFATNGEIQWQEDGAEPTAISALHGLVALDDAPMKPTGETALPGWTGSKQLTGIDRLASLTLEPLLVGNRSIRLTLEEAAEHRRVEVRSLAIRCLTYLGSYTRSVEAFNDESLKSYWPDHYDALQVAMARSRESASQVRQAFSRYRGKDGEALDRMLWGYTPENLSTGQAARLVEYLDHDNMDYRVLAFENLRRITGATHQYRPDRPPSRSQANIVRWREGLKNGEVVYKK